MTDSIVGKHSGILTTGVSAGSKTARIIGIAWADYLKVSFERATAAAGQLAEAGSPAGAIRIQSAFVKASGEAMMTRAATFHDLCATRARDVARPFAGFGLPKPSLKTDRGSSANVRAQRRRVSGGVSGAGQLRAGDWRNRAAPLRLAMTRSGSAPARGLRAGA